MYPGLMLIARCNFECFAANYGENYANLPVDFAVFQRGHFRALFPLGTGNKCA